MCAYVNAGDERVLVTFSVALTCHGTHPSLSCVFRQAPLIRAHVNFCSRIIIRGSTDCLPFVYVTDSKYWYQERVRAKGWQGEGGKEKFVDVGRTRPVFFCRYRFYFFNSLCVCRS